MPVVAHFQHVLGRHCGSTALSDMVRYAGWPLSEAACFGLGAGLESVFLEGSAEYPTGWFLGRGSDLEDVFFKTVNIPDPRRLGESFADVQSFLHRRLREAPVMVQGDVAALPYYNSPEHFTGHKFVVVGTETDGSFLTADTAFPGFQRVTPQALEQAMSFETELFPGKYIYFDIPCPLPPLAPATLSISVKAALRKQAENLLGTVTSQSGPFHHGPRAFSIWKKHLERLAEQTDAAGAASARFMYQVIEKRGTGRGAFRFIYADFLDELAAGTLAGSFVFSTQSGVNATLRALADSARRAGETYRKIASVYRQISLGKSDIMQASDSLAALIDNAAAEEQELARGLINVAAAE